MTEPADAFSNDGEKTSLPASLTVTVVVGQDAAAVPVACEVCVAFQSQGEVIFHSVCGVR
jgi:hypothetical protein